jgi:nicotinamidase-related amidase
MFEIDENNLPIVRTRQAILALDLQNDFIAAGSVLGVEEPPDLAGKIVNLVSHFRSNGNVIWVRSTFETSRPVNLTHGESEKVITDRELIRRKRDTGEAQRLRSSQRVLLERYGNSLELNEQELGKSVDLEADDEENDLLDETFLTLEPGGKPQFVLNGTVGINFTEAVAQAIKADSDMVFTKTHYSAFKDGSLVQILRSNFVTEIYICGALTNISVFATAMDAARHGYTITVIDDCLGYRSKFRHDEALQQLLEYAGCDIISSVDLIKQLKKKAEKSKQRKSQPQSQRPRQTNFSLENLMTNLTLKRDTSAPSTLEPAPSTENSESLSDDAGRSRSLPAILDGEP